ncbi:MAG: hypothetical protein ACI9FN_003819 [Saprospiraceae bacterium]|jgi:hypothetical protein
MMKKNKQSIRPTIESIDVSAAVNPQEVFQNQVLRPIFKLQHDIIIFVVAHAIIRKGNKYAEIHVSEKETYLTNTLLRDAALFNQLKGIIVGMMTIEEMRSYKSDERNLNKRITSLLKKRILDSQNEILSIIENS